ncbi:hypothetical protein TNCV_4749801 [Trichonephila clavipes]|nr:hypothetical protein TNCV_4749801 [Trichonephila clavipes]
MIPDMFNWRPIWRSCRLSRIQAFTTESPHTNTIVIAAEIESGFLAKDDLVLFRCNPIPPARYYSKRRRRLVVVKSSTRNGPRDPKCPSARRFRMVREDTGAPNDGTTYAWMAADEPFGCTMKHLVRCGGLLDDWSVEGVLNLVFV